MHSCFDRFEIKSLCNFLSGTQAEAWTNLLPIQIQKAFDPAGHGDLVKWLETLKALPEVNPSLRTIDDKIITLGESSDLPSESLENLRSLLMNLHPWRKGPYDLFGIFIDTEWRSDWKWQRLHNHIEPLKNRLVLDVGSGNGYHCWRMFGAGAKCVIGVDPSRLNVIQFVTIKHFYGPAPIYNLPVGIEDVPPNMKAFDSVFSMGVLYHRRSPLDHLIELRDCLRPGGELILETLVIEGKAGESLLPENRYAKMRNVWFIPTCDTLISWMKRCGFTNIRLVDTTTTLPDEQRTTEWMRFQSLTDFLDPENPQLTAEGLPAPIRAILLANSP